MLGDSSRRDDVQPALLLATALAVGLVVVLGVGLVGGQLGGQDATQAQPDGDPASTQPNETAAELQSLFATTESRAVFLSNPTDADVTVNVSHENGTVAETVALAPGSMATATLENGSYELAATTDDGSAAWINGEANWTVTLGDEHEPVTVTVEDETATIENPNHVAVAVSFATDDAVTTVVVPNASTATEEVPDGDHAVRAQALKGHPVDEGVREVPVEDGTDVDVAEPDAPDDAERDDDEAGDGTGAGDGVADGDYTCDDFDDWDEADAVYQDAPGEHGLDADDDGIPCESLPGAPDGDGSDDGDQDDGDTAAPAEFELSNLDPADATVTQGDAIDVSVTVQNTGDEQDTQTLTLTIGDEVEIAEDVELDASESEEVTFEAVGTGELAPDEYEHVVSSEDDEVTGTLTVEAQEPPAQFQLSELDPESATVTQGDGIDVSATVANVGNESGTQSVELILDGSPLDSQTIELDAGDEQVVTFENVSTAELDAGEYEHGVRAEDDEITGSLTVEAADGGQAQFELSALEPATATVTAGDEIDVSATVENVGEASGSQSVELTLDGDVLDSQTVELDADESQTVTFESVDTSGLGPGDYEHGVSTEDDDVTGTLTVEAANGGNGDLDCSDFDTWDEANDVFESSDDDEYDLDADGDGVPCESLPNAPDA